MRQPLRTQNLISQKFSFALLPLLLCAPAFAGVVVEVSSYTGADRSTPPQMGRMLVGSGNIRIEGKVGAAKGTAMIFMAKENELVNLAPDQNKAMVIDTASISAFAGFQKQIEQQMENTIANAPPERQTEMRQMMKAQMAKMNAPPPPRRVVKTSETRVINGFPTTKYDVFKGKKKVREVFIAPMAKVPGGKELHTAMTKMAAFLDNVGKKIPGGNKSDAPFEAMLDVKGVPILTRHIRDGKVMGEEEITSTKVATVNASKFKIPEGFKRETLGDAIKGRNVAGPAGHKKLGH